MVLACATTAPILLYLALQILTLVRSGKPWQDDESTEELLTAFSIRDKGTACRIFLRMMPSVLVLVIIHGSLAHLNQSILIWRCFNSDLELCRPNLNDEQYFQLKSDYASMRSRSDYQEIVADLKDSVPENCRLRSNALWF